MRVRRMIYGKLEVCVGKVVVVDVLFNGRCISKVE